MNVVEHIKNEGRGRAVAAKADMSSTEEGIRIAEDMVKSLGRHDILIHNAAFVKVGQLHEIAEAEFDPNFDMNVRTPLFDVQTFMHMTKAAAKYLPKGVRLYRVIVSVLLRWLSSAG